jgi:hypothetical protein
MDLLKIYIVFHKELFVKNTKDFSKQEIQEYFRWVAVNEKIPKQIPDWISEDIVLYEYKMKNHCPLYQMLNFYQNSVFFHLYKNPHLVTSRYIGFGQYDMSIQGDAFRDCINSLQSTQKDKIVGFFIYEYAALNNLLQEEHWERVFFAPYREYYGTKVFLKDIYHLPLCLLHTFILPSWFFFHMMPFVEKILPKLLKELNWNTLHLAGTLERVFALCINCAIFEGKINILLQSRAMNHEEAQHMEDELRGIKAGKDVSQ